MLVAVVPLILAVVGIAGTVLRQQEGVDVAGRLLFYITGALPDVGGETQEQIRSLVDTVVENSTGILSLGTVFFVWVATRLVGTLRTVLREVFDIELDRGIVAGKLFDLKMVVAAGSLFAVNIGITVVLEVVGRYGQEFLGIEGAAVEFGRVVWAQLLAFGFIWAMFLTVYRYLPARRTSWRTSIIAATFTAVLFELMKQGFSWYASVADYGSIYGNLAFLLILMLWIYYTAVVFILGGEVAQIAAMQRIRRRQRERLR